MPYLQPTKHNSILSWRQYLLYGPHITYRLHRHMNTAQTQTNIYIILTLRQCSNGCCSVHSSVRCSCGNSFDNLSLPQRWQIMAVDSIIHREINTIRLNVWLYIDRGRNDGIPQDVHVSFMLPRKLVFTITPKTSIS